MPSGIERTEDKTGSPPSFITDITDENELEEIRRIANRVGKDEKVIFLSQSNLVSNQVDLKARRIHSM